MGTAYNRNILSHDRVNTFKGFSNSLYYKNKSIIGLVLTLLYVKLRHYEKATKFEKKSPTCFDIYLVTSIQVGDFILIVAFSKKPELTYEDGLICQPCILFITYQQPIL